jgi:hypothetical protein
MAEKSKLSPMEYISLGGAVIKALASPPIRMFSSYRITEKFKRLCMKRFLIIYGFLSYTSKLLCLPIPLDAINQPATLSPRPASHTTPSQAPAVLALLDQPAAVTVSTSI